MARNLILLIKLNWFILCLSYYFRKTFFLNLAKSLQALKMSPPVFWISLLCPSEHLMFQLLLTYPNPFKFGVTILSLFNTYFRPNPQDSSLLLFLGFLPPSHLPPPTPPLFLSHTCFSSLSFSLSMFWYMFAYWLAESNLISYQNL